MNNSPFLGMNPYMEQHVAWAGVHLHLLANFGQPLAPQVRPRYRIHTEDNPSPPLTLRSGW